MRRLILVAVAAAVGGIAVGVAGAVVVSSVLADTNVVRERIVRSEFSPSADQPNFSSGWHIHPGIVVIQVQEGNLKIEQGPPGGPCHTHNVTAGDAYIEVPYLPVNAEAGDAVKWTSTLILANSTPGTPDRAPTSDPCPNGNH